MTTLLLTTKLFPPPPRAQLVPRARLVERLRAGLGQGCKLALVSAPAGFGKTMIVVSAFAGMPGRLAWYSLDASDNDPTRFWRYLVTALRRVAPDAGQLALDMLAAPQPPPIETVLTGLLNDLAVLPEPPVLVLDDYHAIENQDIHAGLNFLLDHLPPGCQLALTTRADPPLHLARRRGRMELVELRAADLRFTREESLQFLNAILQLGLAAEDVDTLLRRTEGWAAGLQMAALAMQSLLDSGEAGPSALHDFVASFAGDDHYIGDYLVEEVLQRQPPALQDFLLRTAILERLSGPLCDALVPPASNGPTGHETLLALERANLFVAPLDNRQQWYRYHRLFADLLQRRLLHLHGAQVMVELHQRASVWFESQQLWTEAFEHALQVGDPQRAVDLAVEAWPYLFQNNQLTLLLDWVRRLPPEAVYADPMLCIAWSWACLSTGRLEESRDVLDQLEQRFQLSPELLTAPPEQLRAMPPGLFSLLTMVALQRSTIRITGPELPQGMQVARDVLAALATVGQGEEYIFAYQNEPVAHFNLGLGHETQGEVEPASRAFSLAVASSRKYGNLHILPMAISHLARLRVFLGQLGQAADTYREALRVSAEITGRPSPLISSAHAGLGHLLYEWNELEAAQQALEESLALARPWNNWETLLPAGVDLARVRLAQGDPVGALALLDDIDSLFQAIYHTGPLPVMQVWRALITAIPEQRQAARAALEQTSQEAYQAGQLFPHIEQALLLARLELALPDFPAVLSRLAVLEPDLHTHQMDGPLLHLKIYQAVALLGLERTAEAQAVLEQALALGEACGCRRAFIDLGRPVARLLHTAIRRPSLEPSLARYAAALLAAFPPGLFETPSGSFAATGSGNAAATATDPFPLLEPLSERELEVLRLLEQGLSNSQIAARLYIAHGTVKVHTNNLYGKLGVNSRTAAVARARALGLV